MTTILRQTFLKITQFVGRLYRPTDAQANYERYVTGTRVGSKRIVRIIR